MNKMCKFAIVVGTGAALAPWAVFAQVPADQLAATSVPATATSAAIPLDQQPTKEQLAKLFELIRVRQQVQSLLKMMPAMVQQQMQSQAKDMNAKLPGGTPTPEQQAAMQKVLDKFMQKAFSLYPVSEMLDDMSGLYQRHLTRSDVDAFIAFYASPAGQHLLDAQPAIMQEYMPLVMSRMQERSKTLNEEFVKEMAEIAKLPATVPVVAPPPPPPPPPGK